MDAIKVFKNARTYAEGRGIVRTDIAFGERIAAIGDDLSGDLQPLGEGAIVLPGFIDEHVHGAAGADGMDGNSESIEKIAKALAKEGTTAFLVTTMTSEKETLKRALGEVKNYLCGQQKSGAEVLGIHLEGPFISQKRAGAQPKEFVLPPSEKVFEELYAASGGSIKIVTMAPEVEGAEELIKRLSEKGITVSIGHTDATFEEIGRAMEWGAGNVTHTFNAMTPLHHRQAGAVGAALFFDDLFCELICDTVHVSVAAMKLMVKCKPKDKIILITDGMRAKGQPDGVSELGGQRVWVKKGEARLDSGALAGSVLKMNVAVKNMVKKVGVDLCTAVDFASANPAKALGIFSDRGSIAVGKRADFTVLDEHFEVLHTFIGGKMVF